MARRLRSYVHVDGTAYGPDSEVPAEVAKRIGDHAWEGTSADDSDGDGGGPGPVGFTDPGAPSTVEAPPRSGRGSGVEAWRRFAEANGYDTDDEMSRDDVIALLERNGVIEPEREE
ncbi:hypothetical protein [Streptomyces pini]|uniref:Uncharacterized protein n=1 Tax=Streptomyces pini TaxID=1520580 RepID=A0A1I4BWK8_9ACTN|nr:hypothetical protein [Streptomyces pini]SFK73178.1 hypothetical protein SAMN05192584_108169 [Streptomyces pini]